MKGMNQSFLVDELTKLFFPKKDEVSGLFNVNFPVFVTIVGLLMGSRNHPPQPVVIFDRFFPTFLGPEGLSIAGSKDEQCPSGPHLL